MTEQRSEAVESCPAWCRSLVGDPGGAVHPHVSDDLEVGDAEDPLVARMIQLSGSDQVRVSLGQQVVSVEEAQVFAAAVLRMTASAELAEPGLGFLELLAARSDLSTSEIAFAANLDVDRVRAQRSGGRVLSRREFDRLALAVAELVTLKASLDRV
jgi:hypothetical protein